MPVFEYPHQANGNPLYQEKNLGLDINALKYWHFKIHIVVFNSHYDYLNGYCRQGDYDDEKTAIEAVLILFCRN